MTVNHCLIRGLFAIAITMASFTFSVASAANLPISARSPETICWGNNTASSCYESIEDGGEATCQNNYGPTVHWAFNGPATWTIFGGMPTVTCTNGSARSIGAYCNGAMVMGLKMTTQIEAGGFGVQCAANNERIATNWGECRYCPNQRGNPVNVILLNKYQAEIDYVGNGAMPLRFERHYNSFAVFNSTVGFNWRHNLERSIKVRNYPTVRVEVRRSDGKNYYFTASGANWVSTSDITDKLETNGAGWKYTSSDDDSIELYDSAGRLLSVTNRAGLQHLFSYDAGGRLVQVSDSFGRALSLTYNAAAQIQTITAPDGGVYQYGYTSSKLTTVTYPDGAIRTYHYENGGSQQFFLTGITDENGQRYATWNYSPDSAGVVTLSQHAGGVDRTVFSQPGGFTQVVDALGASVNYFSTNSNLNYNVIQIQGDVCPACGPANASFNSAAFLTSSTDWKNNRTNYTPDARGLVTQRVEGLTSSGGITPQTRTINQQFHPTYRLATAISEPLRRTTLVYGDPTDTNPGNRGSLLTKTIQATSDTNGSQGFGATLTGTPRTWAYTYNANGRLLTADGPRTDISDATAYSYYSDNATCAGVSAVGCRGQVQAVTNAAGHVTQITEYNGNGQPTTIVDPNGLTTALSYDLRQRLISRNVGGETTTYTYDNAGQLIKATLPDGSFLQYTYDPAHRLIQINDNLGSKIVYTLDLMGNRTQEKVFDPGNVVTQTKSRVYSKFNRLSQEIGAQSQTTAYVYDNQGNVTSIDGPLAGAVDVTTMTYDALNRLTRVTNPQSGQVNYGYNGIDQLTSVSDPRSLVTSYSYDGLSNLNQQVSPDTGTTVNTYDAAGNILTQTDAKGQVTTYTYDALNRVSSIVYQGGVTHAYQYDQGSNGLGRLTQITEPNSTTQYGYDQHGRLTSEARTINAVAYTTSYGYDAAGRMTSVTYPSGRQVTYTLDSLGRVQAIATTKDNTTQTVVSSVAYRPFGPPNGFTFGNGQAYTRGFDQDGRISSYTQGAQTIAVGYDPASRIGSLSDAAVPANTNNYGYDTLDRLTTFTGPSLNQAFTYDGVGNRLTKTVAATSDTYTYSGISNRLTQTTGANNRTYTYDPNGSITADTLNQFGYDTRSRLAQALTAQGATDYKVNSLGQRIRKTGPQTDTVFHYDSQGKLIAESTASGAIQKEYIYLGDMPVAILQP
jgi:YD repeat-containing protein